MKYKSLFFPLIIFAAGILFFKLGAVPLLEPDEGRYANISQTMLASGDWMTPRKNGFAHFHKPPMTYWGMALSQKFFGMNEFGVRFPGILYTLGTLLIAMGLARKLWDEKTAIFTALVLIATPLFLFMGRLATTDCGMVFWVNLAIYCFVMHRKEGRNLFLIMTYAALGVAMMAKGPVTIALFYLAAIPFMFLIRKQAKISISSHLLGLIVFFGLAFPWYLWVIYKNPGLLNHFLFYQTTQRVASTAHHPNSFFYFLPIFLAGFFPWSLFAPGIIRDAIKARKENGKQSPELWVIIWAFLILLFFSLIPSKLASYVLPMALPFSLAVGQYFSRKLGAGELKDRWFLGAALLGGLILWTGGLGLGIYSKFFIHERIAGLQGAFLILAGILPAGGLAVFYFLYEKKSKSLFFTFLITLYAAAFVAWFGLSEIGTYKNMRPFTQKILELRKSGEPVIAYRKMLPGVPFYLKERIVEVGTKTESLFDDPEDVKNYLWKKPEVIGQFINSPIRCFILTGVKDRSELEELYPGKLKRLLFANKLALYSNQ